MNDDRRGIVWQGLNECADRLRLLLGKCIDELVVRFHRRARIQEIDIREAQAQQMIEIAQVRQRPIW
ncbi:hypothetical protein [Burkholderia multivorans]|uniref:hypothetical protein n=1 Tax=Burkholderia multivorans TaxID=87883 RepID=UPI0021C1EC60|nr:hypothetical protein [Burkholderia multivorans]